MKDMVVAGTPVFIFSKLLNPVENLAWPRMVHEPITAMRETIQSTLNDYACQCAPQLMVAVGLCV